MASAILRREIQERIGEIGTAELAVGIPSYNNARTIGHVVRAAQAGLAKYFPERRAVLINSDGGSADGTMEIVHNTRLDDLQSILLSHRVEPLQKIATPYHGVPGKGSAFRTIFEIAAALGAKACVVMDSDLRSITPEWIELLLKPVLEGSFDYVAPLYHRHKYDGTITNSIVYPLVSALYGKRVRQPIGGDFGLSARLVDFYLAKEVWESDVARYGIDIWMTTTAVANSFRVCQAFLGAKIHDPKDPGADLSAMLSQVVGSLFELMEIYRGAWQERGRSTPIPTFGFEYAVGLEPVTVNVDRMLERFRLGVGELLDLWRLFLDDGIVRFLSAAATLGPQEFHFPDELWTDTVYRFALAAHRNVINRGHLLASLTPLYIGRTASFVLETWESDVPEVEKKVEALRELFEQKKEVYAAEWRR